MEGIENTFLCGSVIGFIAAGIIGFILIQIRASRVRMGQRNRTLDTFPNAIQSRMTPSNIVWSSQRAMISCIFWIIMLIIALWLAFRVIFPMIDFG